MQLEIATPPRLLKIKDVCARVALSRASIYREEAAGRFPRRVKLTQCTVAWRENEVSNWINERQPVSADK